MNKSNKNKFTKVNDGTGKKVKRRKKMKVIVEKKPRKIKQDNVEKVREEIPKEKTIRKRKREIYDPEEEARLEKLVFGDPSDLIDNLLQDEVSTSKTAKKTASNLSSVVNDTNDSDLSSNAESEFEYKVSDDDSKSVKPAWVDQDDTRYTVQMALDEQYRRLSPERPEKVYTELLENRFEKIVGTPKWAALDGPDNDADENGDSDNEILKHSNHLVVHKGKKLRKGTLDIKALTDINKSTRAEGPIVTSLEFHPTSTVALAAGLSGVLSIFQIDGKDNNKLHSIRFDRFGINKAKFLSDGNEIVVGSRNQSYGQAYDLMSGKTYKIQLPHGITCMQKFDVSPDGAFIAVIGKMGQIHLLSGRTKELVANLKMNRKCHALTFTPDSGKLLTHGESDEMYIWDLKSRSCIHRAIDDGCIAGLTIAVSPSGQFVATGSKQGVVNVYESANVFSHRNPVPLKIIMNLVTPITSLKFNPTSEILSMASKFKENAFKMLHIPSFTVFSNFPTFQTKMFNPLHIDFSPNSGYLGISNNKGHAYLYRLKHYGNY